MGGKGGGPVPLPQLVLAPATRVYERVVARRNRRFDRGGRVSRAGVPVVSVGNLSVGGTGKTPVVMWIVALLREAGRKPGIVMRGYAARPGELSDEQAEYLDRFAELPLRVGANRVAGAEHLVERGARSIVMDDGFQHRFLARDLDIVLVDATRSPFLDSCLPGGWLREPVSSLSRADAVIITHCERVNPAHVDELEGRVCEVTGAGALVVRARHVWRALAIEGRREEVSWLGDRNVVVACGIGNPEAFTAQVADVAGTVVNEFVRRDHHHWSMTDARMIDEAASLAPRPGAIVTTGKDWVKLRRLRRAEEWSCPVARPVLEIAFDSEEEALRRRVLEAVGASAG